MRLFRWPTLHVNSEPERDANSSGLGFTTRVFYVSKLDSSESLLVCGRSLILLDVAVQSVASDVSALSSGVANGHQTIQHVSSSLSKIPYGGFSPVRLQTGSPRQPSCERCALKLIRRASATLGPLIAITGMLTGPSVTAPPVQRPLTRLRVMLSRRVIAYYGLIRDSGLLPPTYALYGGSLWPNYFPLGDQRFPNLLCVSLTHVPHSVPRWVVRLLLTVASSRILAFAIFVVARHPRLHKSGSCGVLTRLQVSLYATARWACSPCPGQDFYFRAFITG